MIQLIRHAESKGNVDSKWYKIHPDWAMPLSENGIQQCNDLRKRLQTNHTKLKYPKYYKVFVSPFVRTQQTLKYALQGLDTHNMVHFDIITDSLIREQDWGNGSRREVKERTEYGTYFYKFDNGESVAQVDDRVRLFLNIHQNDFERGTNVLIFAHGMTNRVLLKNLLNETPEMLETWKTQRNTGIWAIDNSVYQNYVEVGVCKDRSCKFNLEYGDPIEYYPNAGHNHWDILKEIS